MTHQEAAGAPLATLTVWQAFFDIAQLQAGQTIFIPGGAGGVGHLAIQLAKWKGAKVISTTSTRNMDFVRHLGADVVIDYTKQSFVEMVKSIDVVLDTIGGEVLRQGFQLMKSGGTIVSLPGHAEVKAIGDQLAPQYGVTFVFTRCIHRGSNWPRWLHCLTPASSTYISMLFSRCKAWLRPIS